jgi:predicted RNA-binding protein with PUA-like domain
MIYHSNCQGARHRRHRPRGQRRVSGRDPVRCDVQVLRRKSQREQPRWFLVDVAFERKLKRLIPLEEIKTHTDQLGEGFALTAKGSRLSVFPVTAAQWKLLLSLE